MIGFTFAAQTQKVYQSDPNKTFFDFRNLILQFSQYTRDFSHALHTHVMKCRNFLVLYVCYPRSRKKYILKICVEQAFSTSQYAFLIWLKTGLYELIALIDGPGAD